MAEPDYLRAEWRLCKADNTDCVVYTTKEQFIEGICGLDEETDYCLSLRYLDRNLGWSHWSEPNCFTTPQILYVLKPVVKCGEETITYPVKAVANCGEESWQPIVQPGVPMCGDEDFSAAE